MADEIEQKNVVEALQEAAENAQVNDDIITTNIRVHASHTERKTVRSLLNMYSQKKIVLPLCQRLYVWNETKRVDLLDSVEKGYPCGSLELATHEGGDDTLYLCDGLQRLTSLMLMTNDDNLTEKQKEKILNYKISTETVYDLSFEEMSEWFLRLNSGIIVAASVKERSKLSTALNNAILGVSSNDFFRNISKKANTTFRKSHHHEIIAENILMACAGVKSESNKSKDICTAMKTYEDDILQNSEKSEAIIQRLSDIYSQLDDTKIKRSMNANFVSVLVRVMVDIPEISNSKIVGLINYVFCKSRAIKPYSNTTHGAAASKAQVTSRYDLLVELLNNSPEINLESDELNK